MQSTLYLGSDGKVVNRESEGSASLSDSQFLSLVELFCSDLLAELDAAHESCVELPPVMPAKTPTSRSALCTSASCAA